MIFSLQNKNDSLIEKNYYDSIKELNEFFEINWIKNLPKVYLIKDRKTIDKLKNRKTEDWLVGWAKENSICLLDRKNYESESCHSYSKEEYLALFKHELVHLYIGVLCKTQFIKPVWINEGIAIYLSGQNRFKKKPKSFKKFLSFYEEGEKQVYHESGFVIEVLIKNFGKKKLLVLLKKLGDVKNKKEFEKVFREIYGFYPDYNNFNNLLVN